MKPRPHRDLSARGAFVSSLCESCGHHREVLSSTGSRFLLCGLSRLDGRFAKYPPQPLRQCSGYLQSDERETASGREP